MRIGTIDRIVIRVICCFLLVSMGMFPFTLGARKRVFTGITIEKITISDERINTGRTQLIEVLIKNRSSRPRTVLVKLRIVLPNHNLITFGKKRVKVPEKSDFRTLIPYPIHKNRGGDYTVSAKLYSLKGRVLARTTKKMNKFFFAVDPSRRNQTSRRRRQALLRNKLKRKGKKKVAPSSTMRFDPPDLLVKEVTFSNTRSILRGETAYIRLVLFNNGGDIATNFSFSAYWYFSHRQNRKVHFYTDKLKIIAPGEKKIIEIPLTIPEKEQKGKYLVEVVVDERDYIKESNERNNRHTSAQPLNFSDIALVFPQDRHSFAEDGLFKFQWRSNRFNQFKVQVSSDEFFSNLDDVFELPKGDKEEGWATQMMIKPLEGEMPALALALMETSGTDFLFWRVIAKNSRGKTTESASRKFYINLNAEIQ